MRTRTGFRPLQLVGIVGRNAPACLMSVQNESCGSLSVTPPRSITHKPPALPVQEGLNIGDRRGVYPVPRKMWDKPVVGTWINNANACMHLKPLLCDALGAGEKAVIRGRMGISPKGLEQARQLYQSLIQISKQATAKNEGQQTGST